MNYLTYLINNGVTIIMVTHDLELSNYFSRIINVEDINSR